ncbi:hypothetical protein HDV00_001584 [Rhizophlyctis rosea]|nr:hypothetical protein HDV00_001584 [Rhizophlyctis rosea]
MGALCTKDESINDPDRPVDLRDFKIVRAIGKGAFGKVSIVERKKTKRYYALKYIEKKKCVTERAVQHIVQERNLLEEIRHPFVIQLRYSFQDWEYLFMVLDLAMGGDLRFHINTKVLREPAIKIIIAEIASALEYLHVNSIVHRDIKPDNVLLDDEGHAYLTDFNIAVKLQEGKPLKSQAGTEPYMAPEVLLGTGYYTSCDWWSLGVMTFEMTYGERPFRGPKKKDLIKTGTWRFPKHRSSKESPPSSSSSSSKASTSLQSLITDLLTNDANARLGVGDKGRDRLRRHQAFKEIEWEKLVRKEVVPAFVPSKDKSDFDATYDLEELLLNDKPLVSNRKRRPKDWEETREMKMFEELYLYYDFETPRRQTHTNRTAVMDEYESRDLNRVNSVESISLTLQSRSELESASRSTASQKSSFSLSPPGHPLETVQNSGAVVMGQGDDGVGALNPMGLTTLSRPIPGLTRRPSSANNDVMLRNYSMTDNLINHSRRGSTSPTSP